MSVAEKLKVIIKQRGLSYSQLAADAGMAIDTVSRIFLGKRKLSADEMVRLCKAAGVDIADLLDVGEDSEKVG